MLEPVAEHMDQSFDDGMRPVSRTVLGRHGYLPSPDETSWQSECRRGVRRCDRSNRSWGAVAGSGGRRPRLSAGPSPQVFSPAPPPSSRAITKGPRSRSDRLLSAQRRIGVANRQEALGSAFRSAPSCSTSAFVTFGTCRRPITMSDRGLDQKRRADRQIRCECPRVTLLCGTNVPVLRKPWQLHRDG